MKLVCVLKVAAVLCSVGGATSAAAAVMDFEAAPTGGCNVSQGGNLDGFTFSDLNDAYSQYSSGFNNKTACNYLNPTAHSGDNYVVNYNSLVGAMTRDSGTFDLNSLWVHADIRVGDTAIRFQGLDGPLGNVLYTLDTTISALWQEITFNWTGIKTFTWDSLVPGTSNVSIDDITYDAVTDVPLPAGLPLLLAGLGTLAALRRRKGS